MKLRQSVLTALFAAALCVMAPLAVPVGFVPITLATLGVYLAAGLLGPWRGAAAVGLYLLLGAAGLPVFAGFSGGAQQLVGLTGGYLWGYLLCALAAGWLIRLIPRPALVPLWLATGTALLYAAGTIWYVWQTGIHPRLALGACVLPFLPADLIKIAVATALILPLRRRIKGTKL